MFTLLYHILLTKSYSITTSQRRQSFSSLRQNTHNHYFISVNYCADPEDSDALILIQIFLTYIAVKLSKFPTNARFYTRLEIPCHLVRYAFSM